jgi:hypothetical protein
MSYSPQKTKFDLFIDEKYSFITNKQKLVSIILIYGFIYSHILYSFFQTKFHDIDKLTIQVKTNTDELKK